MGARVSALGHGRGRPKFRRHHQNLVTIRKWLPIQQMLMNIDIAIDGIDK